MEWHKAVESDGDGCALLLEVTPNSREGAFPAGFNDWRGRIGVRVHGPAIEGRANRDLVATVARFFHVPPNRVSVESGEADRRKRVSIAGLSREAALAALAPELGADA